MGSWQITTIWLSSPIPRLRACSVAAKEIHTCPCPLYGCQGQTLYNAGLAEELGNPPGTKTSVGQGRVIPQSFCVLPGSCVQLRVSAGLSSSWATGQDTNLSPRWTE